MNKSEMNKVVIIRKCGDGSVYNTEFDVYITNLVSVFNGAFTRLYIEEHKYECIKRDKISKIYINGALVYRKKFLGIF